MGVVTYPPITSCCQAIAPHWKKPDEINAGCWLLQFHGTPHCHPECLSTDWDICKLSSPINSCLVWRCRCPSSSDSEKLWCTISTSSSVSLLKVRAPAKKKKRKKQWQWLTSDGAKTLFNNTQALTQLCTYPSSLHTSCCHSLPVTPYLTRCNLWTPLVEANPSPCLWDKMGFGIVPCWD